MKPKQTRDEIIGEYFNNLTDSFIKQINIARIKLNKIGMEDAEIDFILHSESTFYMLENIVYSTHSIAQEDRAKFISAACHKILHGAVESGFVTAEEMTAFTFKKLGVKTETMQ